MLLSIVSGLAAVSLGAAANPSSSDGPVVDLGYGIYRGVYNSTYDLNIFRGIRYAAPPTGELRWQLPQPPIAERSEILDASEQPSSCPQSDNNEGSPSAREFVGDEDCLFLNVFAPNKSDNLPVMVWIHGGGYGAGSASPYDFSYQLDANENSFIAVAIQYRLGAFGFLSSSEVSQKGIANAALYDIRLALQWVQKNIHLFGGDPKQVTIAGESAGGGAVMLMGIANGGDDGTEMFNGIIAASPYLPTQPGFDGDQPTKVYQRFAAEVGCLEANITADDSVFECLQSRDSLALQNASNHVSSTELYGQWAFIPVTDNKLIRDRPSKQLYEGNVNGIRILTSNVANEAPTFVPQNITTEDDFTAFLKTNYPLLASENVTSILSLYAVPDDFNSTSPRYETNGLAPPYATTTSGWAVGWQQAANSFYGEATFICPSYWLADAFVIKGKTHDDGRAWRFQVSQPPAQHSADIDVMLSPIDATGTSTNEAYRFAFQRVWGNFIVNGDPRLNYLEFSAYNSNGTSDDGDASIMAAGEGSWSEWSKVEGEKMMLNMNMTGGIPIVTPAVLDGQTIPLTSYMAGNDSTDPPLEASFETVNAEKWEDGRGKRCELLASLGPWLME